jgi:hypothetical protein
MPTVTHIDGSPPADRPREWHAIFLGDKVVLRHYAILAEGEHLTEQVPERVLTLDEFLERHAEFGLDAEGQRL